jgi:class 3 adenylate cyclase
MLEYLSMTHTAVALDFLLRLNPLSVISMAIAFIALSIGYYAYGKSKRSKSSVLALLSCITIGIWVFASAFIFSADPETDVWFWYYVQSFGFMPMWPILIHFLSVLCGLDRYPGKAISAGKLSANVNGFSIALFAQYLIAICLHLWILTGAGEPQNYEATPWGLRDTPAVANLCVKIFMAMTFIWYVEGALLLLVFWQKAHRKNAGANVRKQSEVITLTGIVFGGITLFLNIILPVFKPPIPAFGSLFIGIWIFCIAYAVSRYNLGAVDEQLIGERAFALSSDPMVVTDAELGIIFANRAFSESFGEIDPECVRKIPELFELDDCPVPAEWFRKECAFPCLSAVDLSGTKRFFNLESSYVYSNRVLDRILFVLSDITDITNQKNTLEYLVDQRTAEINRQLVITEKYTRPSLVQVIQSGGDPTAFEPEGRDITIMFADIRDFTVMSERLSSADTVKFLNSYFACMNECIVNERGEIDKLIGDAIMALFDSPDNAVHAAIDMNYRLQYFNESQRMVDSTIRNGIGINFGNVTRGNIGSKEKLDYTVIGDSVNAAFRFESLTKRYNLPVIISEEVVQELRHDYKTRFIDRVIVKGKGISTNLYEVFDFNNADLIDVKMNNKAPLAEAYAAYAQGDFESALSIYRPLQTEFGTVDPVLGYYARRAQELLALQRLGKLEYWDGIYQFAEK